jgi:hypothetical protein
MNFLSMRAELDGFCEGSAKDTSTLPEAAVVPTGLVEAEEAAGKASVLNTVRPAGPGRLDASPGYDRLVALAPGTAKTSDSVVFVVAAARGKIGEKLDPSTELSCGGIS